MDGTYNASIVFILLLKLIGSSTAITFPCAVPSAVLMSISDGLVGNFDIKFLNSFPRTVDCAPESSNPKKVCPDI